MRPILAAHCLSCHGPDAARRKADLRLDRRDDAIVVWGGEFGRTPFCQGDPDVERCGRDHHGNAFSLWLAGGGVRAGTTFGASDEFGYNPVDCWGSTTSS